MDDPGQFEPLVAQAARAEDFLKSLASRHRLMILCALHGGEKSVSELQDLVGLRQSSLSQHLARLRVDKLVATRREAQMIYYKLFDEKVARTIFLLRDLFCPPPSDRGRVRRPMRKSGGRST